MAEAGQRRVVVVTGASRGVGRALALAFAARGDAVYGCSRSGPGEGDGFVHLVADVADDAAMRALFTRVWSEHRRLDLVVNNAGLASTRLALLMGTAEFASVVAANLTGAFVVAREALRFMKRSKFGRIVNFTSINVPLASVGGAAYNASKAGLEGLTRTLAAEFAREDITVNCIGLSLVREAGMATALSPEAVREKTARLVKPAPLEIDEIVHAIDFLAAPAARNVTGQTLYFGGA